MRKLFYASFLLLLHGTLRAQTGNTGIGTTTPQAKLHVNGDLRLEQGTSVNKFSTDSLFTSNSHSVIPTEKAIKDYIKTGLWMGIDTTALSDNILVAKGFGTQGLLNPVAAAIQGNYAYTVSYGNNRLSIFDITDHNNPVFKNSISTNISGPVDVEVQGNYAYVVCESNNRLCIFNIANPLAPSAVGFISTGLNMPIEMALQGNFIYVSNNLSARVQIFDITNPLSVIARGFFNSGLVSDLQVVGNFVYTTNDGSSRLSIYDVSNPDAPIARGSTISGLNGAGGVYVKNGFAFVSSPITGSISALNVSNPDLISFVAQSTNEMHTSYDLAGSGNYLFVLDQAGTGIGVYDISNPAAMKWKGFNNTNLSNAARMAVSGETLLVPSYTNDRLCIFELDRSRNISFTSSGFQSTPSLWLNNGKDIYRGNGFVGIGISQPRANLHVEGATYLFGNVGINTSSPQAPFSVEGNSFFNGAIGIGTASPAATLDVQGSGYISGNIGIGTANQFAQQTFSNTLGNKVAIYANSTASQYGLGLQSGLMQLYTDVPGASIALGFGSSSNFTERTRFYNTGYDGMLMNGRIVLRNGTADPNGGAGVWVMNPANSAFLGFFGAQNANNIGFYSNNTAWGFTYNTFNGRVGIGNNNPTAPLTFAASIEKKITLYPGGTGDVGMSVSGNDFRLYADNVNARVSFGYDDFTLGFISRAYVPATGTVALVVGGQINANGTIYNSDARYKKNIFTLNNALEKVMQLRGVGYEMRKEEFPDKQFSEGAQVGLIAQEVEKVVPEVVVTNADGYKSVDYAKLVPVLIEALKTQQQQRQDDLKRIEKLEAQIKQLLEKN